MSHHYMQPDAEWLSDADEFQASAESLIWEGRPTELLESSP